MVAVFAGEDGAEGNSGDGEREDQQADHHRARLQIVDQHHDNEKERREESEGLERKAGHRRASLVQR